MRACVGLPWKLCGLCASVLLAHRMLLMRRGGNGPAPQRQEPQTYGGGGSSGSNGTAGGGGGGGSGNGRGGSGGDDASDSGRSAFAALLAALGLADPEARKKAAMSLGLLAAAVAAFLGASLSL